MPVYSARSNNRGGRWRGWPAFFLLLTLGAGVSPCPAMACSCAALPIHGVPGFGESVDKGAQSSPVIHTNVSYPTLSLMLRCNNIPSCGYLATNSTTLDLPLSSITGLTDGFEQVTETPSSGLFNRMQAYQYGYRMAIGHYGTATQGPTYADLSRNNSPYNIAGGCSVLAGSPSVSHSWCAKFDAITAIIQYAVASGTYADVPAETYTGGEIDTTNGETATQAELDMVTEASTFCSDVKAVEAAYEPGHVQIQCPVIIPDQITSNWVDGTATSYVSIGEFQAARDYPSQIAVSVAKYAFQYAGGALDHRHLTGISESDLGEYQAQAIQTIVRNNSTWQAPQPTAAHLVDATDIHMPVRGAFSATGDRCNVVGTGGQRRRRDSRFSIPRPERRRRRISLVSASHRAARK